MPISCVCLYSKNCSIFAWIFTAKQHCHWWVNIIALVADFLMLEKSRLCLTCQLICHQYRFFWLSKHDLSLCPWLLVSILLIRAADTVSASSAGTAVPPRAQQAAAVFVLFFNFQLILIPQFHASTFCLQPPVTVTNNPWLETKL